MKITKSLSLKIYTFALKYKKLPLRIEARPKLIQVNVFIVEANGFRSRYGATLAVIMMRKNSFFFF